MYSGRTLAILIVVCSSLVLHAQERVGYGLWAESALLMPNADFRAFPGVPSCCPAYIDGEGLGFLFGLSVDLPIVERLRLTFRAGYSLASSTLTREEETVVLGNRPGVFTHSVDASLHDVVFEPLMRFAVAAPFWVTSGVLASFAIKRSFSQSEQITQPLDAVFPNGSSTQNEITDADIPNARAFGLSLLIGAGVDLPLNERATVVLSPEIMYSYGVTNLVDEVSWKNNAVRIGATLTWMPILPVMMYERQDRDVIDTVIRSSRKIVESVIVKGAVSTIEEVLVKDTLTITIHTNTRTDTLFIPDGYPADIAVDGEVSIFTLATVQQQFTPLLNTIYFDDGQEAIPDRYVRLGGGTTAAFADSMQQTRTLLEAHRSLLNIVGYRMQQGSRAVLTITGATSMEGADLVSPQIALRRAQVVRDYLETVWKIERDRIRVTAEDLPMKAARRGTAAGDAENRRVTITSTDDSILSPIKRVDTSMYSSGIARASVTGQAAGQPGVLSVKVGDLEVWTDPPFERSLTPEQCRILNELDAVTLTASYTDEAARVTTTNRTIAVREDRVYVRDSNVRRSTLAIFPIGTTSLDQPQKESLKEFARTIGPDDEVKVYGYADNVGDPLRNQQIATERAEAIARVLISMGLSPVAEGVVVNAPSTEGQPEYRALQRNGEVIRKRVKK